MIISIFKKEDRKQCTNYREISLLSLPGKVYAKCLERKCREIVVSKLEDGQCGFRPGRSTTDQIFTLKQIFEKCWEYGKDFFACFIDLEKAYDRVSRDKLWKILPEYGNKDKAIIKFRFWGIKVSLRLANTKINFIPICIAPTPLV